MKRLLTSLVVLATLLLPSFIMADNALAVTSQQLFPVCNSGSSAENSAVCKDTSGVTDKTANPFITIIKAVMEVISFVTGAAAVILIIVSALKFVTAGGDSQAVASARGTLLYAVIGIVVTVLAVSIVAFVLDKIK